MKTITLLIATATLACGNSLPPTMEGPLPTTFYITSIEA